MTLACTGRLTSPVMPKMLGVFRTSRARIDRGECAYP